MHNVREIFDTQRTCHKFQDKDIPNDLLIEIHRMMQNGPTSLNGSPSRIIFIKSQEEKSKVIETLAEGNKAQTISAPVVAILGYDMKFYEHLPYLFPPMPRAKDLFASNADAAFINALRNASLQHAYFMIIARHFGIGCGPMSGFDENKINTLFFRDTSYKVNFLCNLGYPIGDNNHPKLPRFGFEQVCKIL